MPAALLIPILVPSQFVLCLIFARFTYRNYEWHESTTDTSRQIDAGIWGFLWPLLLVFVIGNAVCQVARLAMTAPSVKERRAMVREAKKERLKDLDRQIAAAEAELASTEQIKPLPGYTRHTGKTTT